MKEFLRTVPLLSQLGDEEIELLARTAKERPISEGNYIVRRGEPGNSAFILKEGAAETRLEKPPGAPFPLSKIGPGELFGELALFDGEPRSASVVAVQDTIVIEISRDMFLREVAHHPEISLRLMGVVAKRLRRAESIVSDYSERIYGDVLPRLESAVSAQLDSAKAICDQSKDRLSATTAEAKRALDDAKFLRTFLTWVVSIISALLVAAVAVAGFFGFDRFETYEQSIKQKESEAAKVVESIKKNVEEIASERKYIKVLKETTLVFDKLRRDLQLGNATDRSPSQDSPGNIARDFLVAHRQLMKDYLDQPAKWESEILVEALDLLEETVGRHYVQLDRGAWDKVIAAIVHAVKSPPEHWRQRQRLSHLIQRLHNEMTFRYAAGASDLVERMEGVLMSPSLRPEARGETALILAKLGSKAESVRKALEQLQDAKIPWRRTQAAIGLIHMGDNQGWGTLRKDLVAGQMESDGSENERERRATAAFAAALLLAEEAVNTRSNLAQTVYMGLDELERQLNEENLSQYAKPWPQQAPVGVALIGKTIFKRLTQGRTAWSRFFWQHSCDLLCRLDCDTSDKIGERNMCNQCFDQLNEDFPPGEEPARAAHSCAAGDNNAAP